jgi:steroid delta-isomerase-like uncharacterized protein
MPAGTLQPGQSCPDIHIKRKETVMARHSLIDAAKASIIAFGEKDWNAYKASVAPDILYHEYATHRKIGGIDKVLPAMQDWSSAFPDSKATIHNEFVSGNTVVLEVTWHGTHEGALQTPEGRFEATGKSVEVPACLVIEVENGKTKSMRHYFDMGTLMQQLGIAKAA